MKYHVPADRRLLWRCWDDEFVVYNAASGGTHLLNLIAADALQILEHSAVDAGELAEILAVNYGVAADETLLTQVGSLLVDFDTLGLIEPAPQ